MIVGMWNKSVILTYLGLCAAVLGMYISIVGINLNYAVICLIIAGIADLFDGSVARKIKRTDEEKSFGVQIDSLVDVMSFIALPITLFSAAGMNKPYYAVLFVLFALCGIARLGYFNVVTADTQKAIKYYTGLPVTYCALIFPLVFLTRFVLTADSFVIVLSVSVIAVSLLEILKVNVIKPKGAAYAVFGIIAIALIVMYLLL